MVLIYAIEALVWAREGRSARARQSLEAGLALLAMLRSFPAWYEVETRLALAEASSRLGDAGRAGQLLSEARGHLKLVPDAVFLEEWLGTLETQSKAREVEAEATVTTLTKAELRTLRYLPTHLSFRQIGDAIGLSSNTVKTQARSIYRKLGASSRAEAVEQARLAGLLEDGTAGPG
jgi:LuxR family maltose regulon positive regulatory protein